MDGRALHAGKLTCIKGIILELIYSPAKKRTIVRFRYGITIKELDLIYRLIPWEEYNLYLGKQAFFQIVENKDIVGIADIILE